jgi:hypothetical protein
VLSNKPDPTQFKQQMPFWLENFIDIYQKLSTDNLSLLELLYDQDIQFQDPMHQITGFSALHDYFSQLYKNVSACDFEITQVLHQDDQAAIYWRMSYSHKRLNQGKAIIVEGHSLIKGLDKKVIYHRDYLDLGQMFYQHLPVLGGVIKWLNKRAST